MTAQTAACPAVNVSMRPGIVPTTASAGRWPLASMASTRSGVAGTTGSPSVSCASRYHSMASRWSATSTTRQEARVASSTTLMSAPASNRRRTTGELSACSSEARAQDLPTADVDDLAADVAGAVRAEEGHDACHLVGAAEARDAEGVLLSSHLGFDLFDRLAQGAVVGDGA